ncbi:MAG TPA: hypothetical protein VG253_21645, partial [Streptosporangiaceae bacterium]|nr:hypothetical protein [Streptosporangiaceae bacterium]
PGPEQATAMLLVRRDSLAVALAAAEKGVTRHGVDVGQVAELMAALADLRASLSAVQEPPRTQMSQKLSQGGQQRNDQQQRASRHSR